ncbi:phosphotransferase family enzyme [Nocardiopsis sp. Huas11]|uniref:phosphotransferase n=1 Tax=Nocardiopsis sp. Huas11 TaxID=2183912 RepID=UPI000EB4EBF2|nr:phosphotransferase [Nocardiopsis sp. Huas11]RKS08998.1 phosphotransferase family enzyme [Nocardiopsis sp. Huas11]
MTQLWPSGPNETPLTGGNVAAEVGRAGATVRKPWLPSSRSVLDLLRYLERRGYTGAPAGLGRDDRGRQVLEYVPGTMADRMAPLTTAELGRVGGMIRRLHDLTALYRPPPDAAWQRWLPPLREEVVCHHDLAPWNLVRDGERWVFVDWDGAAPGSRMEDLGYAAHGFVPLHSGGDPRADALRLRALADGYGCDDAQRRELPDAVLHRVRGMFHTLEEGARTGVQPWARLHAQGHADHWGPAAGYVERHRHVWLEALTAP